MAVLVMAGALALPVASWAASPPPITEAQRVGIIRALVAEVGIARQPLPADKHGVEISPEGKVLNAGDVLSSLDEHGRAVDIGGRAVITNITFKDDRIIFDINGGPVKTHWYDHLEVGMGGAMNPIDQRRNQAPHGAQITLRFAHALPALTPAEVKGDLGSLLDWDPPSTAEVMVRALPAPVKAAIAQHRVLVGMNTDMVVAAVGRTGNKIRETDPATGATYEDWIYGDPPNSVFVRVAAGRVIRVTTYHPGGGATVETQPSPALAAALAHREAAATAPSASAPADQAPPTLRRPGDPAPPTLSPNAPPPVSNTPNGDTPPIGLPSGEPPASSPSGPPGPPY